MTARCPNAHDSTELDYCSVCGAAMLAAAPRAAPPAGASGGCPSCGEPRADVDARFCEVCRYDFLGQKPGPAPRASSPGAPPPPAPPPAVAPPPPTAPASAGLPSSPGAVAPTTAAGPSSPQPLPCQLVVQVDGTLDVDPGAGPACPTGVADVVFPFERSELLVGRRDEVRDVHPDIPLADPGTSRRHAKFVRAVDGSLAFVDLASTNGSKLNGVEVAPGSRSVLHSGDEVTMGRWTRIRVKVGP